PVLERLAGAQRREHLQHAGRARPDPPRPDRRVVLESRAPRAGDGEQPVPERALPAVERAALLAGLPDGARLGEAQEGGRAPVPSTTRAILRQKTLLGETYVELTPATRDAPKVKDGGTIPNAQIAPTVQLDEIFRAFDPPTRAAFRTWFDQQGRAVTRRGAD